MVAPEQPNGFFCLTRKGRSFENSADVDAYRHGKLLPVSLLHPKLAEKVRPMFLRGDYAIAVLQAFIEVEIAVRKRRNYQTIWYGKTHACCFPSRKRTARRQEERIR